MITLRAKNNYTPDDIQALIEVIETGSENMECADTCERCSHSTACADLCRFYNYLYDVLDSCTSGDFYPRPKIRTRRNK